MDETIRCQSCGMPIGSSAEYRGTEKDGTRSSEYCMFCYNDGEFANPDQTLADMIDSSVEFMTGNLGFSRVDAAKRSNEVIPTLRRWTGRAGD